MIDSLLNALGYAGSAIDKPGRAVRGALAGKFGEGLAAVPFSDSLGLTDESNRTSGHELLHALGVDPDGDDAGLAGFGAEMATDPLMFAGAGLGKMLGKGAEAAAVARGPRYGTTAEDLGAAVLKGGDNQALNTLKTLSSPESSAAFSRAAAEVPPGSNFLGAGVEGLAFRTPGGGVVRIGETAGGAPGRPTSDAVLQATRAVDAPFERPLMDMATLQVNPEARALRVERLPFAENVGDQAFWRARDPESFKTPMNALDDALAGDRIKLMDRHAGNVGTVGGRPTVIDPGAIDVHPTSAVGRQAVATAAEPGRGMNTLLDLLGGDTMIRNAVESGQAGPALVRKLTGYGAFGGADLGAYGRTQKGRR